MPLAVGAACRQELVETYIDHDPGDSCEKDPHDLGRYHAALPHHEPYRHVGYDGPDRLGQPAEERVDEGPAALARGVIFMNVLDKLVSAMQ